MVTKEDLIYRQVITLRDGTRVLLRPLVKEDYRALSDLYMNVSFEDRRYMRHDVNDPEVIRAWIDQLDYDSVLPIVAVVGDRIVGNTTLHFNRGPARHRAEIRIFLAKDYRRRGLGNKLLQAVIDIARKKGLFMLEVQVVSDQIEVIKAMKNSGFEKACTFENYFMFPDGELRDIIHLILHLRKVEDEF